MNSNKQKYLQDPPQSYWIATTPQPKYPTLDQDYQVDVAIIGGGITGIACAYLLNKEGVKTAILEANHILQGTTGHTTAKITSQHGLIYDKIKSQISHELARQYAEANETAIRMIEKIAAEHAIPCDFLSQSAYIYTLQDKYIEKIHKEALTASSLGIPAEFIEKAPLPFPIKAAVRFDHQAQFHPRKFLLALAEEFTRQGGLIFEQSRVLDIEKEQHAYILFTNQSHKVRAKKIIIASHYPLYNKSGLYFTRIYPSRSYVMAIKAKESAPDGIYLAAEESGHSLRKQKSDQEELILIGGGKHKTGQDGDTNRHYEALLDFANATFTVEDAPYRWSAQDCMTMDGLPLTGHLTAKTPNLYVATGYAKWGMTNSVASSMLLTDLILHGKSPWQDVYNPSRQTIIPSVKNFIVENLNVVESLIGGKTEMPPSDIDIDAIQPGESKIIRSNGQRTGVYKDGQGSLYVVDTTCSHMGCELNWNSAEKSWDCPCHGSRFSIDGDILEGPAVTPLNVHKNVNTFEKLFKDHY